MPISKGHFEHCAWSVCTGDIHDPDWNDYVSWLGVLVDAPREPIAMFTAVLRCSSLSASQRKVVADVREKMSDREICAHAFVTDSALVRGSLTAIRWLSGQPFLERTFAQVDDGVDWLREQDARLDAPRLRADLDRPLVAFGLKQPLKKSG